MKWRRILVLLFTVESNFSAGETAFPSELYSLRQRSLIRILTKTCVLLVSWVAGDNEPPQSRYTLD